MSAISAPNVRTPQPGASGLEGGAVAVWWGTPLMLGVLLGAELQLQQALLWPLWTYQSGLLAALVCGLCASRLGQGLRAHRPLAWRWAWWSMWLVVGALLAWGSTGWRATVQQAQALSPALEGHDVRVTARVVAMPQRSDDGLRLRLAVQQAQWAGGPAGAHGKSGTNRTSTGSAPDLAVGTAVELPPLIDVAWYARGWRDDAALEPLAAGSADHPVRAGDVWALTLRLKAPRGLQNPHGFDYELWAWEQGVQATGYVRTGAADAAPQWLSSSWRHPVERLRQYVRDAIVDRLAPAADAALGDAAAQERSRRAGVVAALVTGDQRSIDRADWDLYRATGVAHLMSISGVHITLFAWLAGAVVSVLWRRSTRLCLALPAPLAARWAGVALAAAYALFSGWGVPAQRTVLMLTVLALLHSSGRRWPWPQVWLLACVAVVLADPWALLQAGFWLSFVAVGILFASSSGAKGQGNTPTSRHFHSLLREQAVVTLALTPLGLLLFGQISAVSWLANLLAIPWVTLVVTPLALGGVFVAPLWSLAALALQPLGLFLSWLAHWPGAVLYLPAAPWWAGLAALAGGCLLALRLPWSLRWLAVPLLLPVLAWQPARPAPGQFDLLAVDIGQGNAVLLRTAHHSLLYDAGPRWSRESDAGHRVLVPLLRSLGERLDLLVLSHRDADHTGGAAAVLAQQPQARVLGSLEDDHPLQRQRPATPCQAGQQWSWDGVHFEVLHPLPGAVDSAGQRPNTLSCVLRVQAAPVVGAVPANTTSVGRSALLVGDIEAAQERALVERSPPGTLAADWLLVPHHGSKTSSSQLFLEAVAPRTAMVQAGYRNRFGHPVPEVLARYQAQGVEVVESMRCGAARWQSDLGAAQAQSPPVPCQRAQQPRYWHHRVSRAAPGSPAP